MGIMMLGRMLLKPIQKVKIAFYSLEYKYLLDGKVVTEEEYNKILESFDIICSNIYDCKIIEDL